MSGPADEIGNQKIEQGKQIYFEKFKYSSPLVVQFGQQIWKESMPVLFA
jgi:hypothetical protein